MQQRNPRTRFDFTQASLYNAANHLDRGISVHRKDSLVTGSRELDLTGLQVLQERPPLFAPGESLFWDDPYISQQMLAAHIDALSDAVSRRAPIIDREVAWMVVALRLQAGDAVLDLGCGPGLYAERFAQHRLTVTGIDASGRALAYARDRAGKHNLDIAYVNQDYLTLDIEDRFPAVVLVNGDFCALSPLQRAQLLANIHRALVPGGGFALDVLTAAHGRHYTISNQWYVTDRGFWRGRKHLVLEQGFEYPEANVSLNQYVVVELDGSVIVYRNWFQHYTPKTIAKELEQNGFSIEYVGGNLRGDAYTVESEWIGIVAQKPPLMPVQHSLPR